MFGDAAKQDITSACFLPASGAALATGTRTGDILLWETKTLRVRTIVRAHAVGPLHPSVHNGLPTAQGVCSLALNHAQTQLVSGGADGMVMKWNVPADARAVLERGLQRASAVEMPLPLGAGPVTFKGLDCNPLGGPEIIIGTHTCEPPIYSCSCSYMHASSCCRDAQLSWCQTTPCAVLILPLPVQLGSPAYTCGLLS